MTKVVDLIKMIRGIKARKGVAKSNHSMNIRIKGEKKKGTGVGQFINIAVDCRRSRETAFICMDKHRFNGPIVG